MQAGAMVTIVIPDEWTGPFRGNNAADARAGAVWLDGAATLAIDPDSASSGPWTLTATTNAVLEKGGTLDLHLQ